MQSFLLAIALAAIAAPPSQTLAEAEHAIDAGRLDQARIMISRAIRNGAVGLEVERLLAELAFKSDDFPLALARYEALLEAAPGNALYAERAGIAALRTNDIARAASHLDKAVAIPGASWRAWNARGVAADHLGEWQRADLAYARAAALEPDQPEVLNNMGWSLLLRGEWEEGTAVLERAALLDPKSTKIADNLELARTALSNQLPRRRPGESEESWTARLNDAGVVAAIRGDEARAVAAFTQAIEARSRWFKRAANNLERTERLQ